MESFRSRAYAPALTALALLATPHNVEAKGTKNLVVDSAVKLSCPNADPVTVSGEQLEIAGRCRNGVLKIECDGAKVVGASDVKPDPTGISLQVSRLDGRTIEARCKKDRGRGRRIAISFEEVQSPPEDPAQVPQSSPPAEKATPAPVRKIAKPAEPLPPKKEERGLFRSIGAGASISAYSNGDSMVGSPGVFAQTRLGVFGTNPRAALDIEAGFVPLAQKVASGPGYLPRNPGERLKGGMGTVSAGVSGKIWNVLHGGFQVGVGIVQIEGGKDVAIARESDEQGRRALANVPALLALHPLARARLEVALGIRDDISLAFGGRATWTLSALQTLAGEKDNDRAPLIDASAFAAAQYHFH